MDSDEALLNYLRSMMTPARSAALQRVVEQRTRYITTIIEDIFQERNAGAIVRTCDCFGIQEVHVIEDQHRFQVSQNIATGAMKWVGVNLFPNLKDCLSAVRDHGYKLAVASPLPTGYHPDNLPLDQPLALVLGAEKRGVSDTMAKLADYQVHIPMHGFTESLNVSVAAALILQVLTKRLRDSQIPWQLNPDEKRALEIEWCKKSLRNGSQLVEGFKSKYNGL